MRQEIATIGLSLPLGLGSVNCYLIQTDTGYVLIDTGGSNKRADLERQLDSAGCRPGDLALVILTHGDFDHAGNAAHLRAKYGARVAMHAADAGMVESGDMFVGRGRANVLIRKLVPIIVGFGKAERFRPDLLVQDGCSLAEHGLDARVLHIPGHSRGSIAILTANGDLFAGDLVECRDEPALNSMLDDPAAANASLARLKGLEIRTVYPGHGRPFSMEAPIADGR